MSLTTLGTADLNSPPLTLRTIRGWDQTGSNGANLNWPKDFGLDLNPKSNDFWILGLVNAAPYIAASLM